MHTCKIFMATSDWLANITGKYDISMNNPQKGMPADCFLHLQKTLMIRIDTALLNALSRKATHSSRKRKNHNFHSDMEDPLQRMLNAIEPGSYIRPHKHENPDKREAFLIIRGRLLLLEFDDSGALTDHILLDPGGKNHGAEIAPGRWHSMIALEEGTVVFELKDGPYDPETDKKFAGWSPPEGAPGSADFIEGIGKTLNL